MCYADGIVFAGSLWLGCSSLSRFSKIDVAMVDVAMEREGSVVHGPVSKLYSGREQATMRSSKNKDENDA